MTGPRLDHPAILDLLQRSPSLAALREQTVVVTGTAAAALVRPRLMEQLPGLRRQRDEIPAEVEKLVEHRHLHSILTSMPGLGARTAAWLITEVATKEFLTAGHLAAYAGPPLSQTIWPLDPRRAPLPTRQ